MTADKKRFLSLVTEQDSSTLKEVEKRIKNSATLDASYDIAIKVLMQLDELGWTQKELAAAMNVKPQQVNKIVKGQQNLTLDTIVRLEQILGIEILAKKQEEEKNAYAKVTYKQDDAQLYIPQSTHTSIVAFNSYRFIQIRELKRQDYTMHFTSNSQTN